MMKNFVADPGVSVVRSVLGLHLCCCTNRHILGDGTRGETRVLVSDGGGPCIEWFRGIWGAF